MVGAAVRRHHVQQPFHGPAQLVQQVRHTVTAAQSPPPTPPLARTPHRSVAQLPANMAGGQPWRQCRMVQTIRHVPGKRRRQCVKAGYSSVQNRYHIMSASPANAAASAPRAMPPSPRQHGICPGSRAGGGHVARGGGHGASEWAGGRAHLSGMSQTSSGKRAGSMSKPTWRYHTQRYRTRLGSLADSKSRLFFSSEQKNLLRPGGTTSCPQVTGRTCPHPATPHPPPHPQINLHTNLNYKFIC